MITVLVVQPAMVVPLPALGLAFHLLNANSFLGFSRTDPFTPGSYAFAALAGFLTFTGVADWILAGM